MNIDSVTPVLLSFNEEPNLERTLCRLQWARRIILVDSGSTDATLQIASRFPQVEVFHRPFDIHHLQWNFGLDQARTEWVLSLDSDYLVTDDLVEEIKALADNPAPHAYSIPFQYCVQGIPLRASILPPRGALFRPAHARYVQDGHTQLLLWEGDCGQLKACILHDDRKPLGRWLWAQDRYARLEAEKLLQAVPSQLSPQDRLRTLIVVAPWVVLFYTLFARGIIRDGWRGCFYALQRTLAELVLSLHLIEQKLRGTRRSPTTP